jgi:hypothetical protein
MGLRIIHLGESFGRPLLLPMPVGFNPHTIRYLVVFVADPRFNRSMTKYVRSYFTSA